MTKRLTLAMSLSYKTEFPLLVERPGYEVPKYKKTDTIAREVRESGIEFSTEQIRDMLYREHLSRSDLREKSGLSYAEVDEIFNEPGFDYDRTLRSLRNAERGPRVELKREISERDENACVICGDSERLEMHHIDEIRSHNDPSNLVTLCRNHHSIITNAYPLSYEHSFKSKQASSFGYWFGELLKLVSYFRRRGYAQSHLEWIHFWGHEEDRVLLRPNGNGGVQYRLRYWDQDTQLLIALYSRFLESDALNRSPRLRNEAFVARDFLEGIPVGRTKRTQEINEWLLSLDAISW